MPVSVWMLENGAMAKDVFSQVMMRPVVPVLEVSGVKEEVISDQETITNDEKPGSGTQQKMSRRRSQRPKAAAAH
jgi:hypothetical protein